MKTKTFVLTSMMFLFLILLSVTSQAQSAKTSQMHYKDRAAENPNADADIKIVENFLNSLISGDLDKAKSQLASNYIGYGPTPADSVNAEQTISNWKENYTMQMNRKLDFATNSLRVLTGIHKGDWVLVWGTYSFTQNSKDVSFPFQYTARVSNGKIEADITYYDRLYIMETLGYKLTPPETMK
jgi:ketosteroid isomerase-like protein